MPARQREIGPGNGSLSATNVILVLVHVLVIVVGVVRPPGTSVPGRAYVLPQMFLFFIFSPRFL